MIKHFQMCKKQKVHIFIVRTLITQSLNIKKCKLFELQITQSKHPLSISDGKMSKFNTPQYEKLSDVHKIKGAHLRSVNNHYTKYEYK